MRENNLDSFVLVLYVGLIGFFIYRVFKSNSNKKKITGEVFAFDRASSTFESVLLSILLVTGIINLIVGIRESNQRAIITAVVMIALAIVFYAFSRNKLYIGENGLVANSNFYDYKQLKKWGFDTEKADLVLQVKTDKATTNEILKVKKEDIEEINKLIRRFKLNK